MIKWVVWPAFRIYSWFGLFRIFSKTSSKQLSATCFKCLRPQTKQSTLWTNDSCKFQSRKNKLAWLCLRFYPFLTGQEGLLGESRGIALLLPVYLGTRWGWVVNTTPGRLYFGNDPVPIVQEVGWASEQVWIGAENLAPTGIRSPNLPARSELLYRLCYLGWKNKLTSQNARLQGHSEKGKTERRKKRIKEDKVRIKRQTKSEQNICYVNIYIITEAHAPVLWIIETSQEKQKTLTQRGFDCTRLKIMKYTGQNWRKLKELNTHGSKNAVTHSNPTSSTQALCEVLTSTNMYILKHSTLSVREHFTDFCGRGSFKPHVTV